LLVAQDAHPAVRLEVAQRLPRSHLNYLQNDPDWRVRYEVANRMNVSDLTQMSDDPNAIVRILVRGRLSGREPGGAEIG